MRVTRTPHVITEAAELSSVVADYLKHPAFCYDVETMGQHRGNPRRGIVCVVALATDGRHDVIPLAFPHGKLLDTVYPLTETGEAHRLKQESSGREWKPRKTDTSRDSRKAQKVWGDAPPHLTLAQGWELLEPLMMSDRLKVGHNIKFDLHAAYQGYKAFPLPPYGDTMIASFLVNSNWTFHAGQVATGYALDSVSMRELGYAMVKGVGKNVVEHDWDTVMRYAGIDAKMTWLCWRQLRRRIRHYGLQQVMDLEMEVLEALLEMERVGAPVDEKELKALEHRLTNKLDGLIEDSAKKVFAVAKVPKFPLSQAAGRIHMLYGSKEDGGQGLKPYVFTKTSTPERPRPSVNSDALLRYGRNPVVKALAEHDAYNKLYTTYIRTYLYGPPQIGVPEADRVKSLVYEGRIHADFSQIGAATGRFSCRKPNLQNVPAANTEMGRAMRSLFIAPPGDRLVVADFGQIELRVLAHLSGDQYMVQAFLDGQNIHQATADALKTTYKAGKALNFAVVYGAGRELVATMAGCTPKQAGEFIELYDERFPRIKTWKSSVVAQCRRETPTPCVRTLLGRVRYLPNITNPDKKKRTDAERQASNTVVQGSAADIIKLAMVRAYRNLPTDCHMILTVHDELVTTVPAAHADKAADIITDAMQGAYELRVPIPADVKVVDRWSDAK